MDSTAFLKTAELYSWVIHEFLKVVENQVFQDHLVLQTSLPWKFLFICESQLQGQMRTTDLRSARESSSGSVECLSFSLCSPDEGGQSWMVLQCVLQIFLSVWSLAFYFLGFSLILSIRGIFSSLESDCESNFGVWYHIQLISVALPLAARALIQLW